jgi:hypothetical protein
MVSSGTNEVGGEPLAQALGDLDATILLEVVFKDCGKNTGHGKRGTVQCVNRLRLAVSAAKPYPRPAGLKISKVTAT